MTKLIVGVRNFANTLKIHQVKQFMVARHKAMNMEVSVPSKCLFLSTKLHIITTDRKLGVKKVDSNNVQFILSSRK